MNKNPEQRHETPAIEINNLSFAYGTQEVLTHASLVVRQGDYLAIVGPNGGGKTTLIKLIINMLQPKDGSILIFDTSVERFQEWPRIGYVPQHVQRVNLSFPATVLDVVLMGTYAKRGIFHRTTQEDRRAAEEALRKVAMSEFRDAMIGELSGGQTERVFIARALVTKPDILILDEPTAGVDVAAQASLYALLRTLNKEEGVTLLVVSHDIEVITKESRRLAFIDKDLVYYEDPILFTKEGSRFLHGHDH
jgi:zinc transport system ATP-binding protein